jgi:thiamine-phosphate pyrophosphorylase
VERSRSLPRLYPILDAATLSRAGIPIEVFATELHSAGIRFLQYRNKEGSDEEVIEAASLLRSIFPAGKATLILNDRAHLVATTEFDGVHLGQEDLSPNEARKIIGPDRLLGLSTHNAAQLSAAAAMPVDCIAIGPVFGTQSKKNPDPVVGVAGVSRARSLTDKPLIAIGGITLENCHRIFDAGADSIALISALLPTPDRSIAKVLADFLARIG